MDGLLRTASKPSRTCMLLAEYSAAFFNFSAVISFNYKGVKNKDFEGENRILADLDPTIFELFEEPIPTFLRPDF
jgi:predicted amidohydrolase